MRTTPPDGSLRSPSGGDPGRAFAFLVNPTSGGGAAPGVVVPVARLLRDAGARVEVSYSPGPGAVRTLVDAAVARGDVVVSVGGDGMLSSVAGEVARAGGVLGVLPAGRGNDFARMLGVPGTPEAQAALLFSGRTRPVDLLTWGGPGGGGAGGPRRGGGVGGGGPPPPPVRKWDCCRGCSGTRLRPTSKRSKKR